MEAIIWHEHLANTVSSWVTAAALLVAGIWAILRYRIQGEQYPHIETAAEINVIGDQGGFRVVEICAVLTNKGKVEHRISKFIFHLNVLSKSDKIENKEGENEEIYFPHRISQGAFLPKRWDYYCLGPGVTANYTFITKIPEDATFALLHYQFDYFERPGLNHVVEKVIKLPPKASMSSRKRVTPPSPARSRGRGRDPLPSAG